MTTVNTKWSIKVGLQLTGEAHHPILASIGTTPPKKEKTKRGTKKSKNSHSKNTPLPPPIFKRVSPLKYRVNQQALRFQSRPKSKERASDYF